ncbi:MAG: lysostaphin resistance A-like protein [Christensenellaceae bacterium]
MKGNLPQKNEKKYSVGDIVSFSVIVLLCAAMAVLDFVKIRYTSDAVNNELISDTVPLAVGSIAVIWLMMRGKTRLFGRPAHLLYLLPALLVAVNNFPFHSHFTGKTELLHTGADNWILFALYCAFVGIFEECVFRGILFPLMAGSFSDDKKGLWKTFLFSSLAFGGMHLFNIFAGGGVGPSILQAGYSTLIGGLCAYVLMKTKNILLCALIHGDTILRGCCFPNWAAGRCSIGRPWPSWRWWASPSDCLFCMRFGNIPTRNA